MKRILAVFFLSVIPLSLVSLAQAKQAKTIAILPFHNKGQDNDDFLEDAFPQILITGLSNIDGITVAERQSKGILEEKDLRDLGVLEREKIEAQGADFLIEGDFLREKGDFLVEFRIMNLVTKEITNCQTQIKTNELLKEQDKLASIVCQGLRIELVKKKPVLTLKQKRIAVMYFKNISPLEKLDPLQKGFADMIIEDLNKIKELNLVHREEMQAMIDELALNISGLNSREGSLKLGKLLEAEALILGSFIAMDGELRLDARVVKVSSGEVVGVEFSLGKLEEFYKVEKDLVFKLTEFLKITPTLQDKEQIGKPQSKSLEASLYFYKAIDAMDEAKIDRVAMFLEDAVYLEPDFLRAQDYLTLAYVVKQDYIRAIDRYRILIRKFPESKRIYAWMGYLGSLYYEIGKKKEAIDVLEKVAKEYKFEPLYPTEIYSQSRQEYKRIRSGLENLIHPIKIVFDERGAGHITELPASKMPFLWEYFGILNQPSLLYSIGLIYEDLKNYPRVLKYYLKVVKDYPDYPRFLPGEIGKTDYWLYDEVKEIYEKKLSLEEKKEFEKDYDEVLREFSLIKGIFSGDIKQMDIPWLYKAALKSESQHDYLNAEKFYQEIIARGSQGEYSVLAQQALKRLQDEKEKVTEIKL